MANIRIPLHESSASNVVTTAKQVHRQLMFSATNGKGFRADFMERTVKAAGDVPAHFFKPEMSKRQQAKARARAAYLAGVERYGV